MNTIEVKNDFPTREDYLKAAKAISTCAVENTPYVINLLRQGGFDIPELPEKNRDTQVKAEIEMPQISAKQIKAIFEEADERAEARRCVTRIDGTSMLILRELRKQTGLTMMALASKLILEGAQALGLDTDS